MIYVMIGIPGSGKSTYAKQLSKELGCEVISTDNLRNLHPDWPEDAIWPEVYRLNAESLRNGQDAIFDATNATPKVRKRFVDEVEKHGVTMQMAGYFFDTPWEECKERVIKRNTMPGERYLPPEIVESYGHSIIKPTLEEGFLFIKIVKNGEVIEELR